MTPKAQQIAIAKFCGVDFSYELPDYLRDLNAMHAAEEKLDDFQYIEYKNQLRKIRGNYWQTNRDISATAKQRALAFTRTLKLWEKT